MAKKGLAAGEPHSDSGLEELHVGALLPGPKGGVHQDDVKRFLCTRNKTPTRPMYQRAQTADVMHKLKNKEH